MFPVTMMIVAIGASSMSYFDETDSFLDELSNPLVTWKVKALGIELVLRPFKNHTDEKRVIPRLLTLCQTAPVPTEFKVASVRLFRDYISRRRLGQPNKAALAEFLQLQVRLNIDRDLTQESIWAIGSLGIDRKDLVDAVSPFLKSGSVHRCAATTSLIQMRAPLSNALIEGVKSIIDSYDGGEKGILDSSDLRDLECAIESQVMTYPGLIFWIATHKSDKYRHFGALLNGGLVDENWIAKLVHLSLLKDQNSEIRRQAVCSLMKVKKNMYTWNRIIVEMMLADPESHVRFECIDVLYNRHVGNLGEAFAILLACCDRDQAVRASARACLSKWFKQGFRFNLFGSQRSRLGGLKREPASLR